VDLQTSDGKGELLFTEFVRQHVKILGDCVCVEILLADAVPDPHFFVSRGRLGVC